MKVEGKQHEGENRAYFVSETVKMFKSRTRKTDPSNKSFGSGREANEQIACGGGRKNRCLSKQENSQYGGGAFFVLVFSSATNCFLMFFPTLIVNTVVFVCRGGGKELSVVVTNEKTILSSIPCP